MEIDFFNKKFQIYNRKGKTHIKNYFINEFVSIIEVFVYLKENITT